MPADPGFREPVATLIQITNASSETRGRYVPCGGAYKIGVRPQDVDPVVMLPTCEPVACSGLAPGESVPEETECTVLGCAPAIEPLVPGASYDPYIWDGFYAELTSRNCFESVIPELGTAMFARICLGRVDAEAAELVEFACIDYPFDYGEAVLLVDLL